MAKTSDPLSDLHIVDMSSFVAGPSCARTSRSARRGCGMDRSAARAAGRRAVPAGRRWHQPALVRAEQALGDPPTGPFRWTLSPSQPSWATCSLNGGPLN